MDKGTLKLSLFFIGFGLIFVLVASYLLIDNINVKNNWTETTSHIINIDKEKYRSDGKTKYRYFAIVEYSVDGQSYSGRLNTYSSGMRIGDSVDIYYNPENHADFQDASGNLLLVVMMLIGFAPMGIGFYLIINDVKTNSKVKKLKENGQKVIAVIKTVDVDYSTTVGDGHPCELICEVEQFDSPVPKRYRSQKLYKNMQDVAGKSIVIYIDRENADNYIMDIDSIR